NWSIHYCNVLLCISSKSLRIEWPACSPNLNNTTTLAHLQQMLVEEWDAIPQQCVTKLVRRRCQVKPNNNRNWENQVYT
uniref:Transposase Tc1-like domain-containing protein n=1 Tax=Astatotilapia calliptera TaxID=8154 RepID=A0AAX7SII9_ASTCA